ncbi:MAG: TolC family protein, partial [Paracoccaceae bacterium]
AAPVLLVNEQWWRGLKDPVLIRLVDLALAQNLSLAAARARVEAARAEVQAVPGEVSLSGTTALQHSGRSGSDLMLNSSLGFSWLLDPWGARKAQLRGAAARLAAAEAEADAARLLVLFNLANAYVDLRHRQRPLGRAQGEQAGRRRTLGLTRTLAAAEAATRLEIARSEARVAEIEARLPGLRAAIRTKANEIAVLAGRMPGQLPVALDGSGGIPRPVLIPTVGIPADLLRNRPDIRVSEARYYSALADLDGAEAARYPRLSLSGTLSLGHLVGGGTASSHVFGPQLALPAIPGTAARAAVTARAAAVRGAEAQWRQSVIGAVAEVENALIDYQAQAQSLAAAGRS